jgi:glutathione S-transferase
MKLFYSRGACSLSPHIVAEEAGLAVEYVHVHLSTHKTDAGEDFYAINPKGYVPALLLDDGSLLTEGPTIVQYLADLKPEAKLIPECGSLARYHVQEWLGYINSEMHKTFSLLFSNDPEVVKAEARAKLAKLFGYVDAHLAGKSYLMGEHFTVADAYLYVMTSWAIFQKVPVPEHVAAFRVRVTARPHVHAALKLEGLAA